MDDLEKLVMILLRASPCQFIHARQRCPACNMTAIDCNAFTVGSAHNRCISCRTIFVRPRRAPVIKWIYKLSLYIIRFKRHAVDVRRRRLAPERMTVLHALTCVNTYALPSDLRQKIVEKADLW